MDLRPLSLFSTVAYDVVYDGTHGRFYSDIVFFESLYKLLINRNSKVIDLGCNWGDQAELLSNYTLNSIYGIEAADDIYAHLVKRFENKKNITLINKAVSNKKGKAKFYKATTWGVASLAHTDAIDRWNRNLPVDEVEVEIDTLDNIFQDEIGIDLIKIDIEGADLLSLDGGRKLLERNQPFIIIEWGLNAYAFKYKDKYMDYMTLPEFCDEIGYDMYNMYGICVNNEDVYKASVNQNTSLYGDSADFILVPKSKRDKWINELNPKYQYLIFNSISSVLEQRIRFSKNDSKIENKINKLIPPKSARRELTKSAYHFAKAVYKLIKKI